MKLQDFNFANPMLTSIYYERYINDSKGDFGKYSELNPIYNPQGTQGDFSVPYLFVDEDLLEVYKSEPSSQLLEKAYNSVLGYKFFWHPDTERIFNPIGYTKMQPTSSARTMLDMETLSFYAKTDLDKKHFRFIRRLNRNSVIHSIEVTKELRRLTALLPTDSTYSFLPESLGLVITEGKHTGSGVIFREVNPLVLQEEKRIMIPYHSLYGEDSNDLTTKPLLVQLCEIHSVHDPLGFFLEQIIGPIQDSWVLLLTKGGLLPELHGQNALIEIDQNFFPKRLVHRDFQGIYSDAEIRTSLGLPSFQKHIAGEEPGTTRESQFSIVFDNMISKYLLERLVKTFCLYFNKYSKSLVEDSIRNRFHRIPGNNLEMFPETVFKFEKSALDQEGNDVRLVDTGISPIFR